MTWPHRWSLLGFGYWNHEMAAVPQRGRMRVVGVKVPHWFIAGVLAVAPALAGKRAWIRRFTRRRLAAGLCAACGYDVRASNERCPECGLLLPARL